MSGTYDLICQLACYSGALVNSSVFTLTLAQMARQKRFNKPLYWCFVLQCAVDFIVCLVESFDVENFRIYLLKRLAVVHILSFYLISSLLTGVTALVWKYAFTQNFRLTVGLCSLQLILTSVVVLKQATQFTFFDTEIIFDPEASPTGMIWLLVSDTVADISPMILNTLITMFSMYFVIRFPVKNHTESILGIYRKVMGCLFFRVVSTLIDVLNNVSRFLNMINLYMIIMVDEEVFKGNYFYLILRYTRPIHLWLYSISPLTIVWLMHKLLLRVQVVTVQPVHRTPPRMLLLFFIPLVSSDSIILQNDCKRTSEKCFITLEVIKGEPKKDCSIFSTVDRICTIGKEVPTETPRGDEIQVSESDGKTVVSWTGQKTKENGSETNTLVANSIWQRIKRQIKGQVVNCTCTPVRRQKRSAEADMVEIAEVAADDFEEFYPDCPMGYLPSEQSVDPSGIPTFPVITALDEEECADNCTRDDECDSFGFDPSSDVLNCALLAAGPFDLPFGPFVAYKKC